MNKKQRMIIDGLQLCQYDRELLLELQAGEVTCIHACVGIWESSRETIGKIGKWHQFLRDNADLIKQVKTGADIEQAFMEGKIGVILGTQNTSLIEDDISLVSVFAELGVKIMQLTYNIQNLVGSSCYEENDTGLSRFGKLVIEEMNAHGVIVDLSHCGEKTSLDAIAHSSRPVAVTHANPNWIFESKRNKSRELLTALREHQGMLGLCLYPFLIKGAETTLEQFCEMVADTVDFMGIEKVAIGTDLTLNLDDNFLTWMRSGRWSNQVEYGAGSADHPEWPAWPEWFQGPRHFPNIIKGLESKGFSEEEIGAVMGGNWFRFFSEGFKAKKESLLCV